MMSREMKIIWAVVLCFHAAFQAIVNLWLGNYGWAAGWVVICIASGAVLAAIITTRRGKGPAPRLGR